MTELEQYYNKFNEDKRLLSRHGQVEYLTTMRYIRRYLEGMSGPRILEVGAGTGRYSGTLSEEGYDVTAVELVRHNLGVLKAKYGGVRAFQGNALNLKRFRDESFDMTLLLGPMYHLFAKEDKLRALREAERVTRRGGFVFVAYCMNEYCVLTYAFKEGHIRECVEENRLTADFHAMGEEKDLYDYVRLEDIEELNRQTGLRRLQILSPDGPANYMRQMLREMDEETFALFLKYHFATCERAELLGAGAHTLDILQK